MRVLAAPSERGDTAVPRASGMIVIAAILMLVAIRTGMVKGG